MRVLSKVCRTVAMLLAALPFRAGFIHAQVAPESQEQHAPTLTVTTRIVVLDVMVTDKKGNPVHRDLTSDDFTIYEDKQPQRTRSFEKPDQHQMPRGTTEIVNAAVDLKKIGDVPVTILVLDELNSRFEDISFSRQMLVKYLQSQPKVLPQPTVLMIASNSTFQQMHDYTQDRDALIEVVKKHIPEYPWRMMNSGNSGPGAVERMAQVLAALQQIAQASTGTTGRKNLIWIGNGFPTVDMVTMDTKQAGLIDAAMRRCTTRLLAARVTMYTINPMANTSTTVTADDPSEMDQAMDAGPDPFAQGTDSFGGLAVETGGIAFVGRNDVDNVIGQGISKGADYYTLSYAPTNNATGSAAFRNIQVVMKDPNLRATTRQGYFPETAADLNPVVDKEMSARQVRANLELDLSSALTSTVSYNGLSVTAKKVNGNQWEIKVAEQGIGWGDPDVHGAQQTEDTIAAGWYGPKGKLAGHVAHEQIFPRKGTNDGATYMLEAPMTAGATRLRFVVRDALNGRMGTVDVTAF